MYPPKWLFAWQLDDNHSKDAKLKCCVPNCPVVFSKEVEEEDLIHHMRTAMGPSLHKNMKYLEHRLAYQMLRQRCCYLCDEEEFFGSFEKLSFHDIAKHWTSGWNARCGLSGFTLLARKYELGGRHRSPDHPQMLALQISGIRLALEIKHQLWFEDFFCLRKDLPRDVVKQTQWIYSKAPSTHVDGSVSGYEPVKEREFLAFMSAPEYKKKYTDEIAGDIEWLRKR